MADTTSTIVCPECGRSFSLSAAVQAEVDQLLDARFDEQAVELKTATENETRATVLDEVAVELTAAREELGEFQTQARADRDELVALRRELRGERTTGSGPKSTSSGACWNLRMPSAGTSARWPPRCTA